jgi:transketolase
VIDGHRLEEIENGFDRALTVSVSGRPVMIVAKTLKGKGVSFLENKEGWHGKAVPRADLDKALKELGPVDLSWRGTVKAPESKKIIKKDLPPMEAIHYKLGASVATRKAYGEVLATLIPKYPEIFVLDAEVKNSTFAEIAAQKFPDHYGEMFIAEQNMVGVAVGLARRGRIPFLSTFAAFLTRAFDQIRMAAVSGVSLRCVGSHVGVSIGEDGPSQMGLEDISMFRSIHGSAVFYPSDAVATKGLVEQMIQTQGISYLRTSRPALPVIYAEGEKFPAGGSKVVRMSLQDQVTVIGAGVTLFEALKAHEALQKEGIAIRVIDLYSIKPIDGKTLQKAASETKALIVVEDHWFEGGLGDAVLNVFAEKHPVPVYKMAVTKMPGSGKPEELIDEAGISSYSIVEKVKSLL